MHVILRVGYFFFLSFKEFVGVLGVHERLCHI